MKFLDWFRAKPKARELVFTAEVVVSPRKPPNDLPPFVVSDGENLINLLPIAQEVLADYPQPVEFTPEHLADLTARSWNGKYIKVAEYPPGIPRDLAKQMMRRTSKWANWPSQYHRKSRDTLGYSTHELHVGTGCCAKARKLSKIEVPNEEVERLPFNGCWLEECQCDWRPVWDFKRKDKARR